MTTNKLVTYKRKLSTLVRDMIQDWNAIDTNIEEKQNQLIILRRIQGWILTGEKDAIIRTDLPLETSIANLQKEYLRIIEAADKPTLLVTEEEPQVVAPTPTAKLVTGKSVTKPKRKYKKREPGCKVKAGDIKYIIDTLTAIRCKFDEQARDYVIVMAVVNVVIYLIPQLIKLFFFN